MSAEAHEIYEIMLKIEEILNGIQVSTTNIKEQMPDVEKHAMTLQQATRILYRFNHILAHMGLPPDIGRAISKFQQMVFVVRMLQMSLSFLEMQSGYGFIMGVLGITSVAITVGSGSLLEGY